MWTSHESPRTTVVCPKCCTQIVSASTRSATIASSEIQRQALSLVRATNQPTTPPIIGMAISKIKLIETPQLPG